MIHSSIVLSFRLVLSSAIVTYVDRCTSSIDRTKCMPKFTKVALKSEKAGRVYCIDEGFIVSIPEVTAS